MSWAFWFTLWFSTGMTSGILQYLIMQFAPSKYVINEYDDFDKVEVLFVIVFCTLIAPIGFYLLVGVLLQISKNLKKERTQNRVGSK